MKNNFFGLLLVSILFLMSCSNSSNRQAVSVQTNLSAVAFEEHLKSVPNAVILDVRTHEEFSEGHLQNALNIDWTANDFAEKASALDKEKPLFVYCLSGGRSAEAADFLRSKGFKTVYEMDGGIMQWRAANLPLAGAETKAAGMSQYQFDKLIQSNRIILIDFYADWCAPCKKMEPYLKEIAQGMKDKVEVVRINVDDNPELCKTLGVDALPTLKVYRAGKESWTNVGFIGKSDIVKQLQ